MPHRTTAERSIYLPRLNAMKERYNAAKYPTVAQTSGFYAKKYQENNANSLTAAIVAYLTFAGGYATRQQSMGVQRRINGRQVWTPGTTKRGAADINATFRGRSVQVEVKFGRDVISADQRATAEQIARAGGLYIVARTFDGFIQQLQQAFDIPDAELFALHCIE
jgi:hypothetical protein